MGNIVCIYHNNCDDGFGAAWVFRQAVKEENVEFFPADYNGKTPNCKGKDVYILDFSYPPEIMDAICEVANTVTLLDHHDTAVRSLSGYSRPNAKIILDMNRSGAGLTWKYFFPLSDPYRLVKYVEDRDLWHFKMPKSKEFTAFLRTYPRDFDKWDQLAAEIEDDSILHQYTSIGAAILKREEQEISRIIGSTKKCIAIDGYENIPCVNSASYQSEIGNILAENADFAIVYYVSEKHLKISLRSAPEGVLVNKVAEKYGGGGHPHAAGLTVALKDVPHSVFQQLFDGE